MTVVRKHSCGVLVRQGSSRFIEAVTRDRLSLVARYQIDQLVRSFGSSQLDRSLDGCDDSHFGCSSTKRDVRYRD